MTGTPCRRMRALPSARAPRPRGPAPDRRTPIGIPSHPAKYNAAVPEVGISAFDETVNVGVSGTPFDNDTIDHLPRVERHV